MNRALPKKLRFAKMQGVGNDFVVVDARGMGDMEWSGLAREVCDRKFGVGADGLLVIDRSHIADAMMRMYNPDGTPDVCGNGLRCVARYVAGDSQTAHHSSLPAPHSTLTIATLAGVRTATIGEELITVEMGAPRFRPEDIPMTVAGDRVVNVALDLHSELLTITALSTGSTHTVTFADELPGDDRFFRLSPLIETHPLFPERTSVMWCKRESASQVRLRIWERGAGETWGCGTGACAAAVAAALNGYTGDVVTVASKGGELKVEWRDRDKLLMTGPAEYVFRGIYPLDSDGVAW